ncbi:MAG: helix-turn-helix transcriptional regulator [Clostridia bacterium]|nr:helix-turn-helix transcriptional regulator [Clostridia bacterium]
MLPYESIAIPDALAVTGIIVLMKHVFSPSYTIVEDVHPFPEIIYIEKGEHTVILDEKEYPLTEGQLLIYPPNSPHRAKSLDNAKAGILSLEIDSDILPLLYSRVFTLTEYQRKTVLSIIEEGSECFCKREAGDFIGGMLPKQGVEKHTFWRLKKQIEFLLVDLLQTNVWTEKEENKKSARWDREFFEVTELLRADLSKNFTLDEIASSCSMSISKLKLLFREKAGKGPIAFLIDLKIEEAKRLIKEGSMNFTEVAEALGFESLHYFSRQFKKITGFSPSEYSRTVR